MTQAIQQDRHSLSVETIHACPICGNQRLRPRFDVHHIADDHFHHSFVEEFNFSVATIVSCRQCGFQFKTRQPRESYLCQYYANSGEDYLESLAEVHAPVREDYRVARKLLGEYFPMGGSILDLGCGSAYFLESLGKKWMRHGLEVFTLAAHQARKRTGVIVHECDIASAGFNEGTFDVVSCFDVVEHLSNPLPVFREVRRILKPGGRLLIGTGNADSFAARIAGNRWTYMCLPEHLSFFSPRSIWKGLCRAGFLRVDFNKIHHGERTRSVASGWVRAVAKHSAVTLLGNEVVRFKIFRQKSSEFLVPYFFDHMICVAR